MGSNLRLPIQLAPLAKAFRTPVSLPSSSPTCWQMGQPLCAAQLCFLAVSMLIVRTGLCQKHRSERKATYFAVHREAK